MTLGPALVTAMSRASKFGYGAHTGSHFHQPLSARIRSGRLDSLGFHPLGYFIFLPPPASEHCAAPTTDALLDGTTCDSLRIG